MRIGLDFDRVLFNTDEFDDFYKENIEGLHHVEDPEPLKNGCYDPEMHAEICGIDPTEIWNLFENDLSSFLYDDIDLLEDLQGHDLIIVTRGHEKFQKLKIKATGIQKAVKDVVVVQKKSKDSANIDLLVDDREKELERIEIPGVLLTRPEDGLEKVVKKVEDFEA